MESVRLGTLGVCLSLVFGCCAAASTFTVVNTNDTGVGSLRWAITNALASAGTNTVEFNIPGTGPHTVKVAGALPGITNSTSIRGDTQPGYTNTPLIQILGPSTNVPNDFGLYVYAANVTIRGIRCTGFRTAGIGADALLGGFVRIEGCTVDGNGDGIGASGSALTIGGTNTALRNVIINNATNGILLYYGGVKIRGNYIGVAADGVTPAANGECGIRMPYYSGTNTIEGATNYPQVISGHSVAGIQLEPNGSYIFGSCDNLIRGNYIGTDATGTNAVPNANGIRVWGGNRNTIGGTTAADRNVIAGNTSSGISIEGLPLGWDKGTNNVVMGNYIGLGADGETVLSNYYGVQIIDAQDNRIGGTAAGAGNRFGGATFHNVRIDSVYSPCFSNTVQGNWFGISASTQRLSGAGTGVRLGGSSHNLVGGTNAAARNYIGGAGTGVSISGTNAQFNRVMGNWIGLGPGSVQIANNSYGVDIFNASRNQIGGVATNEGNVISGNQYYGVVLGGTSTFGNVIFGNIIGLDPTATYAISNRYTGVEVGSGAYSNRIGGTNAATMNVIAGNGGSGVVISDTNTYGNIVAANYIGLNASGTRLQNDGYGVDIYNASRNRVGGVYTNEANVISGNQWYGVFVRGPSAYGNAVEGNIIGLDPTSSFAVSNRYSGVDVSGGAYSNRVGGTNTLTVNVIGGNGGTGISVHDAETHANTVLRNYVGMTRTFAAAGNKYIGIEVNQSPGNTIGPFNYVGNSVREGITLIGAAAEWNVVVGNFVGQDIAGTAHPNSLGGISANGAPNNQIGINGNGNYVAGNNNDGISAYAGATNTTVLGNYIGLQYPGLNAVLPNTARGIFANASDITIGGTNAGDINYISGNSGGGIILSTAATNARVLGNLIGLDVNGNIASNRSIGIQVNGQNVTIGGPQTYGRNIISGNQSHGVEITATASNVTLLNNYIGVDGFGLAPRRNLGRGITSAGSAVTIGGTGAQEGNLIGGNGFYGINIYSGTETRIYGNSIGIGSDGATVVTNFYGVVIETGARNVTVGTTNGTGGNVIARNANTELLIQNPAGGTRVEGNFIGVQPFGIAFASAQAGFAIDVLNSPSNVFLGNVIGQNDVGIRLNGTGTYNTVVQGNYIGEYQLESISNLLWGIQILNSSSNRIGGATVAERNLIAQNGGGIVVTTAAGVAVGNLLAPNLIYSNSPRLNIDLGGNGVTPNDALDADSGPNNLQNFPTLTNGFIAGNLVYAQGVLTSEPSRTYAVDIYRNQDGTNAGGRLYLGRVPVTTDGSGVGAFTAGFIINLATSHYLAATATDPDNNTSEFSRSPSALANATGDTDGDLIPNYWETLYGLNPAVTNAQGSDADGDGYSDLNEYIADTAANDSNAYPHISSISNQVASSVTFPSSGARVYQLQYNDALATNPVWSVSGGSVTGVYGSTTMTDAAAATGRAYRIGVKLP